MVYLPRMKKGVAVSDQVLHLLSLTGTKAKKNLMEIIHRIDKHNQN